MTKKTLVETEKETYVVALDDVHYAVSANSLEEAIELAKEKQAEKAEKGNE